MAKQSFTLDPNAASYTDNEIVAKINNATTQITRANAVSSTARPLGAGEVDNTILAAGAAKANLDAMSDVTRGYIKTDPSSGEFKIISLERQADGKLKADYDDVPV